MRGPQHELYLDADGRPRSLVLAARPAPVEPVPARPPVCKRVSAVMIGWRGIFLNPVATVGAFWLWQQTHIVWVPALAVALAVLTAGQAGALVYAVRVTADPAERRSRYHAVVSLLAVPVDLMVLSALVICWAVAPEMSAVPILWLAVPAGVLNLAYCVRAVRRMRRWLPRRLAW